MHHLIIIIILYFFFVWRGICYGWELFPNLRTCVRWAHNPWDHLIIWEPSHVYLRMVSKNSGTWPRFMVHIYLKHSTGRSQTKLRLLCFTLSVSMFHQCSIRRQQYIFSYLSSRINHGKNADLFSFATCTCACALGPCLFALRYALWISLSHVMLQMINWAWCCCLNSLHVIHPSHLRCLIKIKMQNGNYWIARLPFIGFPSCTSIGMLLSKLYLLLERVCVFHFRKKEQ